MTLSPDPSARPQARFFVQGSRPARYPNGQVNAYFVNERHIDEQGRPYVVGIHSFSVRVHGAARALEMANNLRDDLNAGKSPAEARGYGVPA